MFCQFFRRYHVGPVQGNLGCFANFAAKFDSFMVFNGAMPHAATVHCIISHPAHSNHSVRATLPYDRVSATVDRNIHFSIASKRTSYDCLNATVREPRNRFGDMIALRKRKRTLIGIFFATACQRSKHSASHHSGHVAR